MSNLSLSFFKWNRHVCVCCGFKCCLPASEWNPSFYTTFVSHPKAAPQSVCVAPPAPHSSSTSVPVVIPSAWLSPPVDYPLWVLQQHQTGNKSHCIITAPCFAWLSRLRPLRASHWPARLLALPPGVGHPRNRTSRLLPWGRWLEERGLPIMPLPVRLALSAALCDARRAERSGEARCVQKRHRAGSFFFGQDAQTPNMFQDKKYDHIWWTLDGLNSNTAIYAL